MGFPDEKANLSGKLSKRVLRKAKTLRWKQSKGVSNEKPNLRGKLSKGFSEKHSEKFKPRISVLGMESGRVD